MEYALKDKLTITKDFLSDLEMKSWQEIENLQAQIANIEETEENYKLIQLLKNLLTSYYVFTGGLENLSDEKAATKVMNCPKQVETEIKVAKAVEPEVSYDNMYEDDLFEPVAAEKQDAVDEIEPFEYFVDFDEPIGDPISDEDLYGNK
jgi:hypothetical protein